MKEKFASISLYSVGILSVLILSFLGIKYLLPVLSPFIISWIIASLTRSPAQKLSHALKIPAGVLRLLMSIILAITTVLAITLIVRQASTIAWHFLTDIEDNGKLYSLINYLLSPRIPVFGDAFPAELSNRISSAIGALTTSALTKIAEGITAFAGAIPQLFLFFLVTLISLISFSLDYDKISNKIRSALPSKISDNLSRIRERTLGVIGKYIKSYSILILMTYFILLIGFLLLGIKRALFLALVVAVLDLLPVIGVGTLLVPWGVLEIATGSTSLGVGLIILFIVNATLRQLLEPKIIGKSLNVHPVVTLLLIYVGYSLFGFVGLILLPVVAVVLGGALKRDESSKIT